MWSAWSNIHPPREKQERTMDSSSHLRGLFETPELWTGVSSTRLEQEPTGCGYNPEDHGGSLQRTSFCLQVTHLWISLSRESKCREKVQPQNNTIRPGVIKPERETKAWNKNKLLRWLPIDSLQNRIHGHLCQTFHRMPRYGKIHSLHLIPIGHKANPSLVEAPFAVRQKSQAPVRHLCNLL